MYTYKIRYEDNTIEYVEATDIQNAYSAASRADCKIDNIEAVIVEHKED